MNNLPITQPFQENLQLTKPTVCVDIYGQGGSDGLS